MRIMVGNFRATYIEEEVFIRYLEHSGIRGVPLRADRPGKLKENGSLSYQGPYSHVDA